MYHVLPKQGNTETRQQIMNHLKRNVEEDVIEPYAEDIDYKEAAAKFLEFNRWTGEDPVLMIVDASATTTGQGYFTHAKPQAVEFKQKFVDTNEVSTMSKLAELPSDDQKFRSIFTSERKRRVAVQTAEAIVDQCGDRGLQSLTDWAENADPYEHTSDPVGQINGVGVLTFQYLRMLAGVDTIKPDVQVKKFIKVVSRELDDLIELSDRTNTETLESCKWLTAHSKYRLIELDQIAWWSFSDSEKVRHGSKERGKV